MANLFARAFLVLLLIILLVDAFFFLLFQRIFGVFVVIVTLMWSRRGEIHSLFASRSATAALFAV